MKSNHTAITRQIETILSDLHSREVRADYSRSLTSADERALDQAISSAGTPSNADCEAHIDESLESCGDDEQRDVDLIARVCVGRAIENDARDILQGDDDKIEFVVSVGESQTDPKPIACTTCGSRSYPMDTIAANQRQCEDCGEVFEVTE